MFNLPWLPFLAVVAIAYLVPGPDFVVVIRGASAHMKAGLVAALGAQAGLSVHMLLATAGLSAVLARSPTTLAVIQVAGAAYLIFLGTRAVVAAKRKIDDSAEARISVGAFAWFRQGLVTNLLNPKAILFFVAILPQFTDSGASPTSQILLLGVVDILLGLPIWCFWIILTTRFTGWLHQSHNRRVFDRLTGGVFVVVGLVLIVPR